MVRTTYPVMIKSFNKASMFMASLFIWIPLLPSFYIAHYNYKRGKVPRLQHYDSE